MKLTIRYQKNVILLHSNQDVHCLSLYLYIARKFNLNLYSFVIKYKRREFHSVDIIKCFNDIDLKVVNVDPPIDVFNLPFFDMYQLKISKSQEYNSLTSMGFDKNVAKIALIITKSNLQAALKILNFNFDQKSEDESEEEESKENGTECKKMESESKDATIDVADNDNGDTKSMEDKWPLGYSDESPSSLAELKNTECQILKFIEKHSSENSQKQSEQEEPFNEFEFENESCNNILQNKDRNQERSLPVSYTHLTLPTICSV